MLGLKSGTVLLSEPDPIWIATFERESARVLEVAGAFIAKIEHVGSTSIPGLCAKPIVDIAAATPSFEEFFAAVPLIEELGYQFKGECGVPRRHFFVLGDPRTVHLHVFEHTGNDWRDQLLFRDRLRRSEELRHEYEMLKRELATKFDDNRKAYTETKAVFIKRVLHETSSPAA